MIFLIRNSLIVIGLNFSQFAFGIAATKTDKPLHILIDPGHGGSDQGAVHSQLKESELVMKMALKLKEKLESYPQYFKISLTRQSDIELSLEDRVNIAKKLQADLMISLHANAAPDSKARGVELFFQSSLSGDEDAMYLASIENKMAKETENKQDALNKSSDIQAIVEDLKRQNRILTSFNLSKHLNSEIKKSSTRQPSSIKQAPFYVLNQSPIPSVLVELGFLTNKKEAQKLIDPKYQSQFVDQISQGLINFKESLDNNKTASLN